MFGMQISQVGIYLFTAEDAENAENLFFSVISDISAVKFFSMIYNSKNNFLQLLTFFEKLVMMFELCSD